MNAEEFKNFLIINAHKMPHSLCSGNFIDNALKNGIDEETINKIKLEITIFDKLTDINNPNLEQDLIANKERINHQYGVWGRAPLIMVSMMYNFATEKQHNESMFVNYLSLSHKHGANPNAIDCDIRGNRSENNTVLMWMIANAHFDNAMSIITEFKDEINYEHYSIDLEDHQTRRAFYGNNPFHILCAKWYNTQTSDKIPILHNSLDLITSIIKNSNPNTLKNMINQPNWVGVTPLGLAYIRGDKDLINLFIALGGDKNIASRLIPNPHTIQPTNLNNSITNNATQENLINLTEQAKIDVLSESSGGPMSPMGTKVEWRQQAKIVLEKITASPNKNPTTFAQKYVIKTNGDKEITYHSPKQENVTHFRIHTEQPINTINATHQEILKQRTRGAIEEIKEKTFQLCLTDSVPHVIFHYYKSDPNRIIQTIVNMARKYNGFGRVLFDKKEGHLIEKNDHKAQKLKRDLEFMLDNINRTQGHVSKRVVQQNATIEELIKFMVTTSAIIQNVNKKHGLMSTSMSASGRGKLTGMRTKSYLDTEIYDLLSENSSHSKTL